MRCTEDAEGGEPFRLGGYVCEESSDWRCFFAGPCASISHFAGVVMASPSASLSSLLSSPESLDERKSGSRSAGSTGRVIPAEPPALTIESMSQNWTTFMHIGKRPIVLSVGAAFSKRCRTSSPERRKSGGGTRTRRPGQCRHYLTNSVTKRRYPIASSRKRGGEQRGASWR